MSDTEHQAFIKTPRQLLVVVILSFLVPIMLIVFMTQLVTGNLSIQSANLKPEAVQARIEPVAKVAIGTPPAAPAAVAAPAAASHVAMSGEAVVAQVCGVCHQAGLAGAPKIGDKAAWAPRIGQGVEKLYANAINGKNAMPARGGNASLTDAEVKAAVDRLVAAGR